MFVGIWQQVEYVVIVKHFLRLHENINNTTTSSNDYDVDDDDNDNNDNSNNDINLIMYFEGFRPEWYISTMI